MERCRPAGSALACTTAAAGRKVGQTVFPGRAQSCIWRKKQTSQEAVVDSFAGVGGAAPLKLPTIGAPPRGGQPAGAAKPAFSAKCQAGKQQSLPCLTTALTPR
jgi:hypothetical protein